MVKIVIAPYDRHNPTMHVFGHSGPDNTYEAGLKTQCMRVPE